MTPNSPLRVGQEMPRFSVPDLHSGALIDSGAFLGRRSIFYIWASW
ncbi:MAG: hypothetical protein GKR89_05100 [Candidatus Latescibacteria bacterium]|nr:hypothetical protein [Candidatus Latescibacterota bacterium]